MRAELTHCPCCGIEIDTVIFEEARDTMYLDSNDIKPKFRWIPCSERLPEQEVRILLFAAGEVYLGELTDIKELFDTDIGFMKNGHVTHWMPLPEPPEKE